MFSTNYDSLERTLIPEGEYECIIKVVNTNINNNGKEYIDLQLQIRNDVIQDCKNQMIFHKIWKMKNPSESDPGGYAAFAINQISKAVLIPNGAQIPSLEVWMSTYITGRPIRVTVVHEEYNGNKNVRVGFVKESKFPDVRHGQTQTIPSGEYAQVSGEDAPF